MEDLLCNVWKLMIFIMIHQLMIYHWGVTTSKQKLNRLLKSYVLVIKWSILLIWCFFHYLLIITIISLLHYMFPLSIQMTILVNFKIYEMLLSVLYIKKYCQGNLLRYVNLLKSWLTIIYQQVYCTNNSIY